MIVDSFDDQKVNGRFVKLKKDNIEKLETTNFKEKIDITGIDEFIEMNAFFVWLVQEDLLLAEYNTESLNILTKNSSIVISKALKRCSVFNEDISLQPFPSRDLITEIIKNGGLINKYHLAFQDLNKTYLESMGLSGETIWSLAESGELDLSQTLTLSKSQQLTDEKYRFLKEIANKLKLKAKKMVVYTDEGNFDLIGNKYVYYNKKALQYDEIEKSRREVYGIILSELLLQQITINKMRALEERRQPSLDIQ